MNHAPLGSLGPLHLTPLAAKLAASSFTALLAGPAMAQTAVAPAAAPASAPVSDTADAAPAPARQADSLNLERVVVTATSVAKSKLKSSLSVTTIDDDLVKAMNPQTQAEVLRLIPGMVDQGGNGPGGNANITVRGLPVTTGGSPFVQIQEDGLPTVLFGDMNFGNNDYWVRFNRSNSIEAVRGGSASVLASGAPGAVINYVSNTGEESGGSIGLEAGLNYNSTKGSFSAGGALAEDLNFHADGFVNQGAGLRDQGFKAQKGYQIKANLTKDLGTLGYIRFNVKLLDDTQPLYTSYPSLVHAGASGFSGISAYPGFDARTGSTVGVYNEVINVLDSTTGQLTQHKSDGLHPVAKAYGVRLHLTPGGDFTVDNKFRYTQMRGTFSTNQMGLGMASNIIGSTVNGQTVGSIVYANGPSKGQAFTGSYLNTGTQTFTRMSDMGSVANDLNASKTFDLAGGKMNVTGGLFYMDQHIVQDWHINSHYQTLEGVNPAGLDLVSTTGQLLSLNGVSGFNTARGSGVNRAYDISAANTAPYLNANWESGALQLDLGVRHDMLRVTGWAESASAATTQTSLIGGSLVSSSVLDPATREALHYNASYNSYSVGALYAVNNDTSAFVRASRGGRFNVDRNILSGYTNADGSLTDSGRQKVVSYVNQQEVGVKNRGRVGEVTYSANATLFHNTYGASNFDLTQGPTGTYYQSAYKSIGVELEGSLRSGGFAMVASMTWTDAKVTANAQGPTPQDLVSSGVGNRPAGVPSLMYMLAPSYQTGDFTGGVMIVGRGRSNVNTSSQYLAPAEVLVNMNMSWRFMPGATVGLNVHNLFNKLLADGHLNQSSLAGLQSNGTINGLPVGTGGVLNGRAVVLSLNYEF
ncbi:TonB-dependent receptor [Piscinibacter sp.]|uniref:TonB-dependent receptor n=1 Tax=Piscinibacter sp. TaxID=1903157 RepID=UPI002BB7EC34|nr:TonB-dependent receptor [Albitalea sp.]HUG23423.1 TonB-dependent receptor [Albitalea sp.]